MEKLPLRVFAVVATMLLGLMPTLTTLTQPASALVGARSYTNEDTGDVFLGGDYIEVGISSLGSFGTTGPEPTPDDFFGTDSRSNIGMSTNPAGFGESPDLRMDFFLPGTPEERWVVGYKVDDTEHTGSNGLLVNANDIGDYEVEDTSSGSQLEATGNGMFNSTLDITQIVSFDETDKFFLNEVTLANSGEEAIDNVRYMRSFDPDNTVDQGGDFATQNTITYTHEAGDGKAVVRADTSNDDSDPVFDTNGSRSPIFFYSNDDRARVSAFGFANSDPYAADAYDDALEKGESLTGDMGITITFDVGTLTPGESETVSYYTSLDNRDFDEVIKDIEEDESSNDNDGVDKGTEDNAPNSGDGNNDGTPDSQQSNVSSLPNPVVGGTAYKTLEISACENITSASVAGGTDLDDDKEYEYPLGLMDFSVDCASIGDSAEITIYYDKEYETEDWVARKYLNGTFVTIDDATFGNATVGSQTVTTMKYSVTDGGELDADGEANGTIVDPAGPAVKSSVGVTAPNTGLQNTSRTIPVAMIIIGAVMASGSVYALSRQKYATEKNQN